MNVHVKLSLSGDEAAAVLARSDYDGSCSETAHIESACAMICRHFVDGCVVQTEKKAAKAKTKKAKSK